MTARLSSFVPACVRFYPFCLCAPTHTISSWYALAPAVPIISLCFFLCHLHLFVPFSPLPPSSSHGPILSSYILCQYLDQPTHYPKHLDKFLAILFDTFTTGLVFARQLRKVVTIPCFAQTFFDNLTKKSLVVKVASKSLRIDQDILDDM